jgi:integrase
MASIQETKGAKSPWVVRWREEGRHRGKRFATESAAKRFLADVIYREQLGAHAPPDASKILLEQWLMEWFTHHSAQWARSTHRQRIDITARWIDPYIGKVRLRDLGIERVRRWRTQCLHDGATPATVNAAARVLSAALTAALSERMIPANPLLSPAIRPLPTVPPDRNAIPVMVVEEIRARMVKPRERAMVSVMAYAGLRPGELAALRWQDVREQTLLVGRSQGERAVKATKTGKIRSVPLIEPVRDDLWALRKVTRFTKDSDLVTPGDRGAAINWKNWQRRYWVPAAGDAGVPYELRHTFASLLIQSGKDVVTVAAWMGHGNPNTTLSVYGHLFAEAQLAPGEDIADAVMRARRYHRTPRKRS